jgi:hypothetical protein
LECNKTLVWANASPRAERIAMILFTEPWFYYLTVFIAGLVLCNIAITGTLISRFRPIVSVKSVPLRIAFFFISLGIFAFLIWMTKHQLGAVLQYFNQPS